MKTVAATLVLGLALAAGSEAEAQLAPASVGATTVHADAALGSLLPEDPADSLYRLGRNALNAGEYREAAGYFRQLRQRYPDSGYAGDAHYWEAFALVRVGSENELKQAYQLLDRQAERYPDARTRRDARELQVSIRAQLARQGDAEAAEEIAGIAAELAAQERDERAQAREQRAREREARAESRGVGYVGERQGIGYTRDVDCDDEDDERLVALGALLQMRSEQAVPILQQVLERRDEGSVCLRRKAVFLLSQKRSDETAAILLSVVRDDPDQEVREQAVFWLSQVNTPQATAALDSILQNATDYELQEKAVFALSQQRSEGASRALRDHLERTTTSDELKENIIFWLGQRRSDETAQYLREYYADTGNPELKEKVIFSLSQMGLEENARWIMTIALDETESIEVRKNALFWAGQMRAVNVEDLTGLYDRVQDVEIKEQLIFVYSQRRETAAVDQLMDIARNDTDSELRGKALFWLSQSNDPRVAEFLLEIINR